MSQSVRVVADTERLVKRLSLLKFQNSEGFFMSKIPHGLHKKASLPRETIERKIYLIRGHRVMLDNDLAQLYQVKTKALLQAVKRNPKRFPDDFMFQLTQEETTNLRSQFVTSSWGGRRYLPFVFTEQGVSMLSSVLKSSKAILVNVAIIRAFVELRAVLTTHKELGDKLGDLEKRIENHDAAIRSIFQAIQQIMRPPVKRKRQIGFHA